MERKNEMIAKGLVGAFITAYYNGEKVSITEANQLIIEKGDGVFAISGSGILNKKGGSETENDSIKENIIDAIPINLTPTPIEGLEYRVFLGSYTEGVPQARSMIFLELDYLGIESTPEDESITYYCGNEGLYSGAEIILKKFTDQGVGLARIVSFQNGEKIDVNEARQLTHE
jgi:hypothetical protein